MSDSGIFRGHWVITPFVFGVRIFFAMLNLNTALTKAPSHTLSPPFRDTLSPPFRDPKYAIVE